MAVRGPALTSPMNSQFFLPRAHGLMAFSTLLCRLQTYAAWQLEKPLFHLNLGSPMIDHTA
jgi:hypothetical protein